MASEAESKNEGKTEKIEKLDLSTVNVGAVYSLHTESIEQENIASIVAVEPGGPIAVLKITDEDKYATIQILGAIGARFDGNNPIVAEFEPKIIRVHAYMIYTTHDEEGFFGLVHDYINSIRRLE